MKIRLFRFNMLVLTLCIWISGCANECEDSSPSARECAAHGEILEQSEQWCVPCPGGQKPNEAGTQCFGETEQSSRTADDCRRENAILVRGQCQGCPSDKQPDESATQCVKALSQIPAQPTTTPPASSESTTPVTTAPSGLSCRAQEMIFRDGQCVRCPDGQKPDVAGLLCIVSEPAPEPDLDGLSREVQAFCHLEQSPRWTLSPAQIQGYHQEFVVAVKQMDEAMGERSSQSLTLLTRKLNHAINLYMTNSELSPNYRTEKACLQALFERFSHDGMLVYRPEAELASIGESTTFREQLREGLGDRLFQGSLRILANRLILKFGTRYLEDPESAHLDELRTWIQKLNRAEEAILDEEETAWDLLDEIEQVVEDVDPIS